MSVAVESQKVTFTGDGTTRVFTYTFQLERKSDLRVVNTVIATGVEADQQIIRDYDINLTTKQVTFTIDSTPPATEKVTLIRRLPLTQNSAYKTGRKILAATHTRLYDRLTQIAQDVDEEIGRQIIAAITDDSVSLQLEPAATRADRIAHFDGTGKPDTVGAITTIVPAAFWTT